SVYGAVNLAGVRIGNDKAHMIRIPDQGNVGLIQCTGIGKSVPVGQVCIVLCIEVRHVIIRVAGTLELYREVVFIAVIDIAAGRLVVHVLQQNILVVHTGFRPIAVIGQQGDGHLLSGTIFRVDIQIPVHITAVGIMCAEVGAICVRQGN